MRLYRIAPKSTCDPADQWLEDFRAKYACPECRFDYTKRRGKQSVNVCLAHQPDASAVNCVTPPGVGIARRDFLDIFGEEAQDYLQLGGVFFGNGKQLHEFVTFVGTPLLIRGGPEATINPCRVCGYLRYWPGWHPPWYVLTCDISGQSVYESYGFSHSLIVTQDIRDKIQRVRWKGIEIIELPVLDSPLDGLTLPTDNVLIRG